MRKITIFLQTFLMCVVLLLVNLQKVSANIGAGTQSNGATSTAITGVKSATNLTQLKAAMEIFLDQYSMNVITDCPPSGGANGDFDCTSLSDADLANSKNFGIEFIEEWSKYPVAWVAYTSVQNLYMIKQYGVLNTPRAAAPGVQFNGMIYDVGYAGSEEYMREVIHHEYMHYVEYVRTGGNYSEADATWSSYNPSGFTYGNGGFSCYQGNCATGEHPFPGFVTGYATSGIEEDKAETYAYIFSSTHNLKLLGWINDDANLAQKTTYLKNFMQTQVPGMDNTYFSAIQAYSTANNTDIDGSNSSAQTTNPYQTVIIEGDDQSATNYVINEKETLIVKGKLGNVVVTNSGVLKGTGSVGAITLYQGGILAPGLSPGCLSSGNLTFVAGSTYEFEVAGPTACTEYDQTTVTGTVTLGNGTLSTLLVNGFKPVANQTYKIIDNDGTDAVTGTFNGLAEGATFTVGGYVLKVSYVGGDGNDVVLTVQTIPTTPDTGFTLIMNNPLATLMATTTLAGSLIVLSRKYAYAKRAK